MAFSGVPDNPNEGTPDGSHIRFGVTMTCSGCSGAVERTLSRVQGIKTKIDMDKQTVDVDIEDPKAVTYDDILARIKKTGKTVNWGNRGVGDSPEAFTDEGEKYVAAQMVE